jgi:uncharacterized protein (DUF952 family)
MAFFMDQVIYKICSHREWDEAEKANIYKGSADDLRDGFIHFSTKAQVQETARRYFMHQYDLILCAVAAERLREYLRYEPSHRGILYPHLYAPLPLNAVLWVKPIKTGEDGAPLLQPLLM